jgi:hypothetical protein
MRKIVWCHMVHLDLKQSNNFCTSYMQFYVYLAVRIMYTVFWNNTPCKSVRYKMEAVGSIESFVPCADCMASVQKVVVLTTYSDQPRVRSER